MTGNGKTRPYRIDWSAVKPVIRRLRDRALTVDMPACQRLASALREMELRLQHDPLAMGEPKYNLDQLGILVCAGFHLRFRIKYGIQQRERQVYILEFEDLEAS